MGKYIYQVLLTPEEDGGYSVEVPDLPGCFTYGDTYEEAALMAADAARTYVASLLKHGDEVPAPTVRDAGGQTLMVFFEAEESYIVDGETVSAAKASRMLGVSAGRVTHMLDSGILDGFRSPSRKGWHPTPAQGGPRRPSHSTQSAVFGNRWQSF